jgi:hypothetical protein
MPQPPSANSKMTLSKIDQFIINMHHPSHQDHAQDTKTVNLSSTQEHLWCHSSTQVAGQQIKLKQKFD